MAQNDADDNADNNDAMRHESAAQAQLARGAKPERDKVQVESVEQWGVSQKTPPKRKSLNTFPQVVPLRVWLILLMVVLTGMGLMGTSAAVSSFMRDYTLGKVDEELDAALNGWASFSGMQEQSTSGRMPMAFYVERMYPDGTRLYDNMTNSSVTPDISELREGRPQTVPSAEGSASSPEWRAKAVSKDGVITVVAKNLSGEESLLARLKAVQAVISLVILLVLALVGSYLVHRALAPLREVERTAGLIAEGELDRRVPQWPINTEVGQLAYALNVMLGRLQRSVQESRSKEEQMRRFVGDASHELRTPLTSLRGYTELYRSGATKDVDMVLRKVDEESKRMSLLVEDLLSLTRAEGQRLNTETVDVLELCLSVASTARAAFPGREVRVDNTTATVPLVRGDASRLHQVLLNLVTNALRHGGEEATATIRLAFDERDTVLIQVIDDGVGMSAEDASHIFERFYRADTSRSRASGGSGLGLAITKSLVEKHGGTIKVESAVGVGSTFSIRLGRAEA